MQKMIFATGMGMAVGLTFSKGDHTVDRIATFKGMSEEHMDLLRSLFEPYSCRSGAMVIQQGKPAEYLYLIVDGKVEVSFKPYDGTPITVSHVGRDGLFGWSAVLGSGIYTSSVTAIEDLETFRIHGNELRRLCLEHPEAGRDILERLANGVSSRWKNAHEQVKSILVQGLKS